MKDDALNPGLIHCPQVSGRLVAMQCNKKNSVCPQIQHGSCLSNWLRQHGIGWWTESSFVVYSRRRLTLT